MTLEEVLEVMYAGEKEENGSFGCIPGIRVCTER